MNEEKLLTMIMNSINPAQALETAIKVTLELLVQLQSSHTASVAVPPVPDAKA